MLSLVATGMQHLFRQITLILHQMTSKTSSTNLKEKFNMWTK